MTIDQITQKIVAAKEDVRTIERTLRQDIDDVEYSNLCQQAEALQQYIIALVLERQAIILLEIHKREVDINRRLFLS